jgi:hypothetical protein
MSLQKFGHTIVETYPENVDLCEYCDCFKRVFYIDSQTVCDECFEGFFYEEDE